MPSCILRSTRSEDAGARGVVCNVAGFNNSPPPHQRTYMYLILHTTSASASTSTPIEAASLICVDLERRHGPHASTTQHNDHRPWTPVNQSLPRPTSTLYHTETEVERVPYNASLAHVLHWSGLAAGIFPPRPASDVGFYPRPRSHPVYFYFYLYLQSHSHSHLYIYIISISRSIYISPNIVLILVPTYPGLDIPPSSVYFSASVSVPSICSPSLSIFPYFTIFISIVPRAISWIGPGWQHLRLICRHGTVWIVWRSCSSSRQRVSCIYSRRFTDSSDLWSYNNVACVCVKLPPGWK